MLTILCWTHHNARYILWCLRSLLVEICKTWPHASMVENSYIVFNGSIPNYIFQLSKSNRHLFKILKLSGSSLLGMTSSILQPTFLSGGILWQMVIIVSFAHEHKTAHNDYAPGFLTRIVQSLTKLNNRI